MSTFQNMFRETQHKWCLGYTSYKVEIYNIRYIIYRYHYKLVYPVGINICPIMDPVAYSLFPIGYSLLIAYGLHGDCLLVEVMQMRKPALLTCCSRRKPWPLKVLGAQLSGHFCSITIGYSQCGTANREYLYRYLYIYKCVYIHIYIYTHYF